MRRVALLVVAAVALTGCGGEDKSTTTSAGTTATTGAQPTVKTFFYRRAALVPVATVVPETQAVARASLQRLLAGPPEGYETAIPPAVELVDLTIEDGVATADFSRELGEPSRTAQGQIVSTLAQFPTVRGVAIAVEGNPVGLQDGSGKTTSGPAAAADYDDLTPLAPIFVATPARDSTVSSPVRATGTANVFEATLAVDVWSGGKRVATKTITASAGSGTRGAWSATLPVPSGDARLVFYEPSAEDGSHLHETEVLLRVK